LVTEHWLVATAGLELVGDPSIRFDVSEVIRLHYPDETVVSDAPHSDELPGALAVAYLRIVADHGK
jgi:hypothetical protein